MSENRQPILRPRGVLTLFDAAFEVASTSPAVVALSVLGMAPVAVGSLVLWYGATEAAFSLPVEYAVVLACALATLWRYVPAGAVARLVREHLAGRTLSGGAALGEALRRMPSLMAAGSLALWVVVLSLPLLFLPMLAWSGTFVAVPMVMERDAAPWAVIGASRRLLGERSTVAALATLLWLIGVLLLAANLWAATAVGLWLASALFDLETGLLSRLLSPANPLFIPTLGALALIALEPIRQASMALLYIDGRVRREGLDLAASLDALGPPRRSGRLGRVASVALLLTLSSPLALRADDAGSLGRDGRAALSRVVVRALSEGVDVDVARYEETLDALPDSLAPSLVPLAERLESELEEGNLERADTRLRVALEEMEASIARPPPALEVGPMVESVLSRPEFQRATRPRLEAPPDEAAAPSEPGWLARLFERFLEWLREVFEKRQQQTPEMGGSGTMEAAAWIVWGLALALILAVVAVAVLRALGARERRERAAEPGASDATPETAGTAPAGVIDALARAPDAWLAEADRLAAEGRLREAVRAAFLALLSALHRSRAIDYRVTHTNWDHVRSFRGPQERRGRFRDLTRRFEYAWYGMRGVTVDEYREVRADALALTVPVAGAAHE